MNDFFGEESGESPVSQHHPSHTWENGNCTRCKIAAMDCECSAESGCARKLECPGVTHPVYFGKLPALQLEPVKLDVVHSDDPNPGGGAAMKRFEDYSTAEILLEQGFFVELRSRIDAVDALFRDVRKINYDTLSTRRIMGMDYGLSAAVQILRGVDAEVVKKSLLLDMHIKEEARIKERLKGLSNDGQ